MEDDIPEISASDLKEFQDSWFESFNESIAADEARLQFGRLVRLYRALYEEHCERYEATQKLLREKEAEDARGAA